MFNYRPKKKTKKKTQPTFPILESYGVFKTNQLAKATCAEIVLGVTGRQPLYWHVFVMQCGSDGGLSGRQAYQNLVGGRKKQKVDGMCQKDSLCCIHQTMTSIQDLHITMLPPKKLLCLHASLLMGWMMKSLHQSSHFSFDTAAKFVACNFTFV